MAEKQITRRDVAARAGVSETIVSYVLNNNRYVAQDKRERVLHAVQELHYQPNSIARALKGKRSNHILFIADHIANEHFGNLVQEMDQCAYDRGYLISLLANRNSEEFISQVISRQTDGIVISSVSFPEEYIQRLVDAGIPVVWIANRVYHHLDPRVGKVYPGMLDGMKQGVQCLIARGRTNIIYIDRVSQNGNFSTMDDLRYRGFCEQMQESGLPFSRDSIFTGYSTEEELYTALLHRIRSGARIDGVAARNDTLACIAMAAVQECGLRVPDDVSVVGFDNARISRIITPHLTTVEIDRPDMARAIIDMLDAKISGEPTEDFHFSTKLIERDSV